MSFPRSRILLVLTGIVAVGAATASCWLFTRPDLPLQYGEAGRPARLDPDYGGCTIPPNITPLNFQVKEEGTQYCVRIAADSGPSLVVASRSPGIVFPEKKWRELLDQNSGQQLSIDVYVRGNDRQWQHFDRVAYSVAAEKIDGYVAYRRLKPLHNAFENMGTYQRSLEGYEETRILRSPPGSGRCCNCHTFASNQPDRMLLHLRGSQGPGMLLAHDGVVTRIDTRTKDLPMPASYSSWHPNGKLVAFSVNSPMLLHHAVGDNRDVFDFASDLGVYDLHRNCIVTAPQIADPKYLETFPCWSPDGKYLYFSRALRLWPADAKKKNLLPSAYNRVRYDLCRVAYDDELSTWGDVETLLDAQDTGLSSTEPRVSPDGRWLLFCMHQFGCFPVYQASSDLYLLDLTTRNHWRLEINSDHSDSWHCWSSNSRWIVFASKRRDGLFGRLFFSYIAPDGAARKPFLLPQQDPAFYESFLETFNAPELIRAAVPYREQAFLDAIRTSAGPQTAGSQVTNAPN
jgi:Tol biopolymer transport system component